MPTLPPSAKRARRRKYLVRSLLLVMGAWFALLVFLDRYGQVDRAANVRDAQAIIVLGARVNPGGGMSITLWARAQHALELYRAGKAPHIICTGGVGTFAPAESVATSLWLQKQGVPARALFTETTSTNTLANLANSAIICRAHDWQRVIIVSDPYHLWRAGRDARLVGLTPYVSPARNQEPLTRLVFTCRETLSVIRDLVWVSGRATMGGVH